MVHGTIFVVRSGFTQYPHVARALEAIGRDRILGVVLNAVEEMPDEPYGQYASEGDSTRQVRKDYTQ
jgi:hypothetical protein